MDLYYECDCTTGKLATFGWYKGNDRQAWEDIISNPFSWFWFFCIKLLLQYLPTDVLDMLSLTFKSNDVKFKSKILWWKTNKLKYKKTNPSILIIIKELFDQ